MQNEEKARRWTRVVVYADLNCPFCYALECRLAERGVSAALDWKLVEHAPELPSDAGGATQEQLSEVEAELEALKDRAPEVAISRPPFRSNSRPGIVAIAQALREDPGKAGALRRLCFEALWKEGRNIADPSVLQDLAKHAGLSWPLGHRAAAEEDARKWTQEWRDAELNRIPSMVTDAGTHLLGLSPPRRLDLFLDSGLFSSAGNDACIAKPPAAAKPVVTPSAPSPRRRRVGL